MKDDVDLWETEPWLQNARSLLQWADSVVDEVPLMLLVRHSHRESVRTYQEMAETGITSLGEKMAVQFATRLPKGRGVEIRFSPISRCVRTAKAILEGYQKDGGKVKLEAQLPLLAGPKVTDNNIWLLTGEDGSSVAEFVNDWGNHTYEEERIESFSDYCNRLAYETVGSLRSSSPGTLHILVTHDIVILSARVMFFNEPVTSDMRPPYLGGLGLTIENDRLMAFEPFSS